MYLDFSDKYWVIDVEADSLIPTVVWCLCAVNVVTGDEVTLVGGEDIKTWVDLRKAEGCKFVGHNIIAYDAFNLNRLLGTRLTISDLVDTLLLSMIYSPSLGGGHSLEDWGTRLRFPKGRFDDFSRLSDDMVAYCLNDCRLTRRVYVELVRRLLAVKQSEVGLDIEHRSWQLIQQQKRTGFPFNIQEANILYAKLRGIENDIRDEIYIHIPPTLECIRSYKRAFKQDGSSSRPYLQHLESYERLELTGDGGYNAYQYVPFNIGSPDQRVAKLLELGWIPGEGEERTETGKPKPTSKGQLVPSLVAFVELSGRPEPRLIARWMEINARANMVNTWIEAYDERTGRIHGSLWLANTLRYRHSGPNTANIPAVRVDKGGQPLLSETGAYTYEARDLWTCSDSVNRRLVGVDAKGIQLRVLAHYLNNKEFTDAVLGGDPHSYNQAIGGFASRAIAKTFIYAFLLGAGDAKVGQIISGSQKDGKEVKRRFVGNFPGLRELLERLEREIERNGRIRLCDGTSVIVTAPHTRLGYLLQGDESRIMKKAAILTAREVQRRGLDVQKVGDIHDEWQTDVLLRDVDPFIELCNETFPQVGRFFNYRIPINCDTKVGLTWAETH